MIIVLIQSFVQHIGFYWTCIHTKTDNAMCINYDTDTDSSVTVFSKLGCAELVSVSVTNNYVRYKAVYVLSPV